jgi:hypothetical protein
MSRTLQELIGILRSGNDVAWEDSAEELGRFGVSAAPSLIALLKLNKGDRTNKRSIKTLAKIGAPIVASLLAAIRDDEDVRINAIYILYEIGSYSLQDLRALHNTLICLEERRKLGKADQFDVDFLFGACECWAAGLRAKFEKEMGGLMPPPHKFRRYRPLPKREGISARMRVINGGRNS